MSGFEVVGLVLSLYPVVIDALRVYQSVRSGEWIAGIAKALQVEEVVYEEFVEILLKPNVSEAELVALMSMKYKSPELERWRDTDLHLRLSKFFGPKKARAILSKLEDIQVELESIRSDLASFTTGGVTYRTRVNHAITAFRHARPGSGFREHLRRLISLNVDLQRLMQDRKLPSQNKPFSRSLTLEDSVRQDNHAIDIYNALRDGYRCSCEGPHSTMFGIPDSALLALSASDTDKSSTKSKSSFKLLFSIDSGPAFNPCMISSSSERPEASPDPVMKRSREDPGDDVSPSVYIQREEHSNQDSTALSSVDSSTTLNSSVATFPKAKNCSVSVVECATDRAETIHDLCNIVRKHGNSNSATQVESMGVLRSRKKRKYELQSATTLDEQASQSIVSLEDLLASTQYKLARRLRVALAMRLSYAVLQFHSTPWITGKWSWNDFSITKTEDQRQDEGNLFVTHQFYSSLNRPPTSTSKANPMAGILSTVIGEPVLTRLGFALIEIALGKRLSELRIEQDNELGDPDMRDFATACRILDSGQIQEEESCLYEDVVEVCLRHRFRSAFGVRCLDSSEPSFRKDAEQVIIEPLHSLWAQTWGVQARQVCF